jgi:NAD(P)-dependent dehydrogenase (short-subunit alcohol dehydrogenase family)
MNGAKSPIALVTGGAHRIGRAICRDLSAHGWAVAVHYNRSADAAEELAGELREAGGRAMTIGAELADPVQLAGIFGAVQNELGHASLLVNNASMFVRDEVGRLDQQTWDTQLAVNLSAPVFLTEAFARQLPSGTHGNVVNLLDQRVLKPMPVYFSYQISKSALLTATRTMAQALAPQVRVNAIAPGPTLTHVLQPEENFENETRNVLLQRGADLAEFGNTVRYFVENRSITGQVIALDGGQHLAWQTADQSAID